MSFFFFCCCFRAECSSFLYCVKRSISKCFILHQSFPFLLKQRSNQCFISNFCFFVYPVSQNHNKTKKFKFLRLQMAAFDSLDYLFPPNYIEVYAYEDSTTPMNIALGAGLGIGLTITIIFWVVWRWCLKTPAKTSFLVTSSWDEQR